MKAESKENSNFLNHSGKTSNNERQATSNQSGNYNCFRIYPFGYFKFSGRISLQKAITDLDIESSRSFVHCNRSDHSRNKSDKKNRGTLSH
jgi:hypothetical protein